MLIALAFAATVAALPLTPVAKWVVDYEPDMCVLSRDYRQGDTSVTLAFRPVPMGNETEIMLLTSGGSSNITGRKAHVTLLPAGTDVDGIFNRQSVPKPPQSLARLTLADGLLGLSGAETINIRLEGAGAYSFAMPAIKAGLRALATCQASLLKSWGIDPAERDRVATPPAGNPAAAFGPDAYPAAALQTGQQGRAIATLMVANSGSPTTCTIVVTSGSSSLDQATCSVLKRAKFKPGRDKDGNAIAAHVVVPVRWALPR